jgi:hypothetical protein
MEHLKNPMPIGFLNAFNIKRGCYECCFNNAVIQQHLG